ncbi:MAG TPA: hypothetical protein VET85_06365 [Stellaceae bacterium]|nr:hypothetical protein [Stellaceae bacterium]
MTRNIDRYFVATGAVLGIIGMAMGIVMGVSQDFTLSPVHAHINLVGWVSMVLFGLAYRGDFAPRDLWAAGHYWIGLVGAVLLPTGIFLAITREHPALAILGSLFTLASMVLFLVNVLRGARAKS